MMVDKKCVKVYEFCNNDWFDCGIGFCIVCFVMVCCVVFVFCMVENMVLLMIEFIYFLDLGRVKRILCDCLVRRLV